MAHLSLLHCFICSVLPLSPSFFFLFCSMMIPGNASGVAKQFLRCIFHQLAPNGILPQLFQSNIKGNGQCLRFDSATLHYLHTETLLKNDVIVLQMEVFYGPWPRLLWISVS